MSKKLQMSLFVLGDWDQNKMATKEEEMPGAKEILMLLILGVGLQSWDSYSDLHLSYRYFVGETYNREFNNTPI